MRAIFLMTFLILRILVQAVMYAPEAHAQANAPETKQDLVQALNEYTIGSLYKPLILKHVISLEMSPEWWARMNNKDQKGLHALSFITPDLNQFAKRMGWGDAEQWESSGKGTKEEWKPRIDNLLNQWQPKFTVAFKPDSPKCDSMNFDLALRYFTSLASFLSTSEWKPTSGEAHITLVPSASAKDIAVNISKDGKSFTILAPIENEPSEWDTKMQRGLKRAGAQL